MAYEDILATWLVKQRWFAGKGRIVHDVAVVADTEIIPGDPGLRHLIVTVSHGATSDDYQIFVGVRARLPARLRHAWIGTHDGQQFYDGLHDSALTRLLLDSIVADRTVGPLRFCKVPGAEIGFVSGGSGASGFEGGMDSLVLTGEQSNTSLVFGESAILKVFRRVTPGPNPDLEVSLALARLGSSHIAEPYGWAQTTTDGTDTVLAILSRYLRAASDGWSLAATSVRDLYATEGARPGEAARPGEVGGDFAGEAERLGATTAQIHRDLAQAFGRSWLETDAIRELAEQMSAPAGGRHRGRPRAGHARGHDRGRLLPAGQADRAGAGPARARRLSPGSGHADPDRLGRARLRGRARQLAGAAPGQVLTAAGRGRHAPLVRLRGPAPAARPTRTPALAPMATDWVRRNSEAFCAGYAAAGGPGPGAELGAAPGPAA